MTNNIIIKTELPNELQQFLNNIHQLRVQLFHIRTDINILNEKLMIIQLDDTEEDSDQNSIKQLINKLCKESMKFENEIKEIKKINDLSIKKLSNETIDRIKRNHLNSLTIQFVSLMRQYQIIQLDIKSSLKMKVIRKMKIYNPSLNDNMIEENIEKKNIDNTLTQQLQQKEDKIILNFLEERHRELLSINDAIEEINEMFISLAVLIETQGELVNSIEDNCNLIKEYTKQINEELQRTYHLKKKLVIKIVIFIIFIVIILILILCIIGIPVGIYLMKKN
ncbi:syntaxin-3, putative [Entamoeba dispar SAW760]|uniref:Syntaxin-3, putative n=1 Tax=Entamoeba dispar (strain ATCC PRA-260 / SAW760) TaxID=370354 RepID=B0E701_ENTDS|nr:syntaxin-3, putative [Entamoeba dispar SAW760]EDR29742.1 syntaxin-3, putative [Entamoeba dispar SAW760]|eukprot:EDR29742.1 syntaxin-3, putative [Entamoeba dispar SAW760]